MEVLDQAKRQTEKQAARDRDHERLVAGEVTREQLAAENDWFAGLDVRGFEILAVGGRPL